MSVVQVYTCFDARGSQNPATTDLKYYFLLRAWSKRAPLAHAFSDVHRSGAAAKGADLRRELANRLHASDVLLLILSERTSSSEGWLSWEIRFALEVCRLPVVCAYTGGKSDDSAAHRRWWPEALEQAVSNGRTLPIHVPFQPAALATVFSSIADGEPKEPALA